MTSTATAIEYDLCIAYAAADADATDRLRDWSAKLVRTLQMRLAPPDFEQDPCFARPKCYVPGPGAFDWEAILAASARSTLLFVIVSPAFCGAPDAAGVIKAFLDANSARGGTADSLLAITAFPTPDGYTGDSVMKRLVSTGEKRRADFYHEVKKEPIEFDLGKTGKGAFVLLQQPIAEVANEIRDKLDALRKLGFRIDAPVAAGPAGPASSAHPAKQFDQPLGDDPATVGTAQPAPAESDESVEGDGSVARAITAQLYLRGYNDVATWDQTRTAFDKIAIVSPEVFTQDANGASLKQRLEAREDRINALITCNAMALVRATPGDKLLDAAKTALWDLNYIRQKSDPDFVWMLADWVSDPPPALPEGLIPPRVFPRSPDFVKQVQAVLTAR